MKLLLAILFSGFAHAEVLQVESVQYTKPAQSASCGLLKQRELERQKVIRELEYLQKLAAKGKSAAILLGNNLLVNKLFMPNETWRDLNAQVSVTVKIPDLMMQEITASGARNLYLAVVGPGFVWQSFAFQIPPEMAVRVDTEAKLLHVQYHTYLNVICLEKLKEPRIEWIPAKDAPSQHNTYNWIEEMLLM